jgi:RNA polymerase sigma-70 factor, ECF subfamily
MVENWDREDLFHSSWCFRTPSEIFGDLRNKNADRQSTIVMKQRWNRDSRNSDPATRTGSAKIIRMVVPFSRTRSFEELALPELASLYNHAHWLVRDDVEAEDLVQETLTKALRAFESFRPGTNFRAWIFRIQKNTFLSSRTALAYTHTEFLEDQTELDEVLGAGLNPELEMIQLNNAEVLHTALRELPIPLREVILLCDMEEFKYREIAEILGIPIGTVMSRLSRGRQTLRTLLTPHLGEHYER